MGQVTTGFRSILSNPVIYTAIQRLMGGYKGKIYLITNYIKPHVGANILDIGCGPAEIVSFLPAINYWGYDISQPYISKAKEKYSERGKFYCKNITIEEINQLPKFDIVLALGVLHHLNDHEAKNIVDLAFHALKPGGRLVTIDPCLEKGQNFIARFLINLDRGQNVRSHKAYIDLVSSIFVKSRTEVRHRKWIPYTHCYMECTRE